MQIGWIESAPICLFMMNYVLLAQANFVLLLFNKNNLLINIVFTDLLFNLLFN